MKILSANSKVVMVISNDNPKTCPRMILGNSSKYARIRDDYSGEIAISKNLISKLNLL